MHIVSARARARERARAQVHESEREKSRARATEREREHVRTNRRVIERESKHVNKCMRASDTPTPTPTRTPTAQPPQALLWQTQRLVCPRLPVDESCHTCGWVMSHVWMSHVTHMNEAYEWVSSISVTCVSLMCAAWVWFICVTRWCSAMSVFNFRCMLPVNESWHAYEWVMAHVWMSHGTRMNESWHTYEWVVSHVCGMSLIYMYDTQMQHRVCLQALVHETHHMYERVKSHVCMSSFRTCEWGMSHIWMSHVTHVNETCHKYEWGMSQVWRNHAAREMYRLPVRHANESHLENGRVTSHIWKNHLKRYDKTCCIFRVTWLI